jgi:hypothetical protein
MKKYLINFLISLVKNLLSDSLKALLNKKREEKKAEPDDAGRPAAGEEQKAETDKSTVGKEQKAETDKPTAREEQKAGTDMPVSGEEQKTRRADKEGQKTHQLPTDRQDIIRFNEQFLRNNYDLRYNVLKHNTEFRPKEDQQAAWQPLTDRDMNRLVVDQLKEGGNSWTYGMRLYIDSTYIPRYNPVADYLSSCGEWDGARDYIEDYARRLPTDFADWPRYFHRWFLALVAQALGLNPQHGNSMVPLLIGQQGVKKTTFCRNILPPELREYYLDDIKMDNAEQAERVLARMWLVCIDEYNAKTPREQAKIKRLLTEKDVQVRRMRSEQYVMTQRLCSFIATTNDPTPLPSGDGTRRYLCVGVSGEADMAEEPPYRQMFAQAQAELQQEGCIYWFTNDDERLIQEHNRQYQQLESMETVLESLFEPAQERRRENLWQVLAIQRELAKTLRTADVPSLPRLASALRSLRWPQGGINGVRGYYLQRKTD